MVFTCHSVASKFTESIKKIQQSSLCASIYESFKNIFDIWGQYQMLQKYLWQLKTVSNDSKISLTSGDSIKWFKNIFDIWGQYQMIQKYPWHLGTVSNVYQMIQKYPWHLGTVSNASKKKIDICVSVIGFNNIFNLRANIKSVKTFFFTSVSILKASTIPKVPNISNIFFLNLSQ